MGRATKPIQSIQNVEWTDVIGRIKKNCRNVAAQEITSTLSISSNLRFKCGLSSKIF